jgi:hypothetical protein
VNDLLRTAFAALIIDGYSAGVGCLRRAVDAMLDPAAPDAEVLARFPLGMISCQVTLDDSRSDRLLRRVDGIARRTGALRQLDTVLCHRLFDATMLGRLAVADAIVVELRHVRSTLGSPHEQREVYRCAELIAWRADHDLREQLRRSLAAGGTLAPGAAAAPARTAMAQLEIGSGRYREASTLAQGVPQARHHLAAPAPEGAGPANSPILQLRMLLSPEQSLLHPARVQDQRGRGRGGTC